MQQDLQEKSVPEQEEKQKEKKTRLKIHEVTAENDIRYRGPLSYRHLKIIAWIACWFGQLATILGLLGKASDGMRASLNTPISVFSFISTLMAPMFLFAAFSALLNRSTGFRPLLIKYGAISGAIIAVYLFLYFKSIPIAIEKLMQVDRAESLRKTGEFLGSFSQRGGFVDFNLFIDLFLCTLFLYFLMHNPRRVFVGNKRYVFRAFALLPIAYELTSLILKMLGSLGVISIHPILFPFLTTKPPVTFLLFVVLSIYIKRREHIFRKAGKTHEEYEAFLKTRTNSFQFSRYLSIMILVAVFVDLVFFLTSMLIVGGSTGAETNEELTRICNALISCGIGKSLTLVFTIPVVLLFSYTRTHENKKPDRLIPIIGLAGIALIYIEGIYRIVLYLPEIMKGLEAAA